MAVEPTVQMRFVVKRDGHVATYDFAKIARSVYASLEACGTPDALLGREVAELVEFYLVQEFPDGRVSSEVIGRMTEEVLRQTQLEPAAEEYRAFQDRRDFVRGQLEVRKPMVQTELFQEGGLIGETLEPWNKHELFLSLLRRGFDVKRSESVSNTIERELIRSGMRSVSARLLEAWTDNVLALETQDQGMFRRAAPAARHE